jgi:hypothetical protein
MTKPQDVLKHHVSGAVERGEKTPIAERTQKIDFLKRRLKGRVEDANADRAKLVERLQKSNAEAYRVMGHLHMESIALGAVCQEVLELMANQGETEAEWVTRCRDHYSDALRRFSPEFSTNPYSNAAHLEQFNALKRLVEYLEDAV